MTKCMTTTNSKTHRHRYTDTHIYTYTQIHTYTHTHIHTYTQRYRCCTVLFSSKNLADMFSQILKTIQISRCSWLHHKGPFLSTRSVFCLPPTHLSGP